jgi:pyridoxal phosphate enzyme (YggS family)
LQRNKIERTLPLVSLIHSVDSIRLLQALDEESAKRSRSVSVLLEVNASEEANKHGFAVDGFSDSIPQLSTFQHVRIVGLMTMAALTADPEEYRRTFRKLRELRDRVRKEFKPPHQLTQLSMGMTNDFEIAIEEGATLVRIGTALFEGLSETQS